MVDYVEPIEKKPEVLKKYVQHWYVNGDGHGPPVVEKAVDQMHTIVGLLRARIKYDFSCYKKGTLNRRVQRRMGINHIDELSDYVEYLRKSKDEVTSLYKDLLISVTNFFREPEAWAELEKEVIVPLVHAHDSDLPIRVWIPGCATGEEAYSLAMLLMEQCHAADKACNIQIFASDIDQNGLAVARIGIYPESIAADVSPERLRQFFTKGEHTYRISKEVRDAVVFAEQNIVSHPPFSKLDLISCRNLMIYLEPEIQKKIFRLFHFALNEGGCVFLGNSETISQPHDLFEAVSRKWRIYRRLGPARPERLELPAKWGETTSFTSAKSAGADVPRIRHLSALAQQLMLHPFAPACALINRKLEVQFLNGPVDEYLQLPAGEPATDLIGMAREGLRTKLRAGIQQAIRTEQPVVVNGVRIKRSSQQGSVRLIITPLRTPKEADGLLLVRFEEETKQTSESPVPETDKSNRGDGQPDALAVTEIETLILQLEDELRLSREDLQSTIEELETSNEEFKAANEEVTSVNEELQSTNEELETSKEELQSLNEELQTVNNQLEQKITELEASNNDLTNFLASTDIPTIFLDRQFRIKRFTPSTTRLMRVIRTDVGRSFEDLAQNFSDTELLNDAAIVLERLVPIEREIQDHAGHVFARRIVPYRTEEDRIDGVVITFNDITRLRQDEQWQRESAARARAISQSAMDALIVMDHAGHILDFNAAAEAMFGRSRTEVLNRPLVELIIPAKHRKAYEDGLAKFHATGEGPVLGQRVEFAALRADGTEFPVELSITRIPDSEPPVFTGFIRDITQRNRDEVRLKEITESLEQRVTERTSELESVNAELRVSEQQLAELADRERQQLGRDLHDSIGQEITAIGILIALLKQQLSDDSSSVELVDKLETNVEKTKRGLRALNKGLFPVDVAANGLSVALRDLAQEVSEAYQVNCRFESPSDVPLDDNFTATQLFMIVREAAHNAAKHANASEIVIHLEDGQGVCVSVRDNGQGLPHKIDESATMGLRIIKHRSNLIGATLQIESPPEAGTLISCRVAVTHET